MNELNLNTASLWLRESTFNQFPALEEDATADVCIIGAGITGITSAYLLSELGYNVVVLENGEIATGTTGHTTAKISIQHGLIYDSLIKSFGAEQTKMYYEANNQAKEFIKETIDSLAIDCDFSMENAYLYTNDMTFEQKLADEFTAYQSLSIPHNTMVDTLPIDLPIKQAIKLENQAQFHPIKYLQKLVEKCIQNKVVFHENTRVIDIEYNKRPAVVTKQLNRVICNYVIQASHYPIYDGEGYYPVRMYADRSYIIACEMKNKFESGMYINAEMPKRSIRSASFEDKELVLIAGEGHKAGQVTNTYEHYIALQKFARNTFQVKNIPFHWSAQDYETLDQVPFIGPVTKHQRNILVATGFRKWGMTNGTNAAQILTDIIHLGKSKYDPLFSPSRDIKLNPLVKNFIMSNADVAKHLIKGKITPENNDISQLKPNDACLTTINGSKAGVYLDENDDYHAVDSTCTHLGCTVGWNKAEKTWDCPCHGSRFTPEGKVINGPAVKDLERINLDSINE